MMQLTRKLRREHAGECRNGGPSEGRLGAIRAAFRIKNPLDRASALDALASHFQRIRTSNSQRLAQRLFARAYQNGMEGLTNFSFLEDRNVHRVKSLFENSIRYQLQSITATEDYRPS